MGKHSFHPSQIAATASSEDQQCAESTMGEGDMRQLGDLGSSGRNVWVANYHGNSITKLEGANGITPGRPLSPASGLGLSAGLSLPFAVTVDASGNLWVSSFANDTVSEYLGAAAPVHTPRLGPPSQP
jgi:DNA-binding beta-propeller fold protein YncE